MAPVPDSGAAELGLIARDAGRFRLTGLGEAVGAGCEQYWRRLGVLERLCTASAHLDDPTFLSGLMKFAETETPVAEASEPFNLLEWWNARLAALDRYRGLTELINGRDAIERVVEDRTRCRRRGGLDQIRPRNRRPTR